MGSGDQLNLNKDLAWCLADAENFKKIIKEKWPRVHENETAACVNTSARTQIL